MACFSTALGVLILSGFITLSANKETCDPAAAVGQKTLTLPFDKKALSATDTLKWTHDGTIIFHRQSDKVSTGKPADVTATGDLQLSNLKLSDAGEYKAYVHDLNGTLVKGKTISLCVMEKVRKPAVTFACDSKAGVVTLTCNVGPQAQDLIFAWTLDGKPVHHETKQILKLSLTQQKGVNYGCSAENKVGKETSIGIQPTCTPVPPTTRKPDPPKCKPEPPTLLCFKPKTVLVALAGAASAILLLIIVITVLCHQRKRRMAVLSQRDRGHALRMSPLTPAPDPLSHEYESMHPTERSPPPSPKASPTAYTLAVPQPGSQASSEKSPQASTAAEGQKQSPVPKPRTKAPQTTGN